MSLPLPDHVFAALGADGQNRWHHRLLVASSPEQVKRWWQYMLSVPPSLVLSLPQIEQGLANLMEVSALHEDQAVWGGWIHNADQVRLLALTAPTYEAAEQALREQCQGADQLACVVDPSPWLALLAHARAVVAGAAQADENLHATLWPSS